MTIKICPLCEEGELTESVSTFCSYCESESAGSKHLSLNKEIVLNFRKEVDESLNKPLACDDSSYIEGIKND